MKDYLIKKFKKARLQSFFRERESYQHQYAFVGVGNHSLSNLYPVLSYLNVPLKYIHTRSDSANKMASFYGGAQATDDLDVIGSDPAVKGVFISVDPEAHFAITKKLLEAGKKVFVEKPPCMTKDELQELISLENSSLLVGLQKRYSALNNTLRKSLKQVHSYRYAYTTGSYPEGDPRFDIFIHAIDNVIFLFGDLDQVHVT
ncbi:MAG: Gfo/Idh/MocA family oxidoreductase, partial [Cyclobacteriaceae bacterium]|nr:Gfo/Idh/MocA family oxidoreductase [Cyclobacteriaceae bacterium HetDA_MAG_MS6]